MSTILSELRIALRSLLSRPGYSGIIVLTFALGIGSTATVYTVVNALRDRSFPYPDSERILWMFNRLAGQTGIGILGWSYPEAMALKEASTIELPEPSTLSSVTVTGREEPLRLQALFANAGYFELLGARPALGRLIAPDEARVPGGHLVAVLSHEIWESAFGSDPAVLGTTLTMLGAPYTVVGVMEAGFVPPPSPVDIYLPAMQYSAVHPAGEAIFTDRSVRFWIGNGRLAEGVTPQEAQAELARLSTAAQANFPGTDEGIEGGFWSLGYGYRQGTIQPLLVLMAGAGVLLLIGCFNITSLMLVRGSGRAREMAVRMSLGASRASLVRLLTLESLLLASAGGVLGIGVAQLLFPLLMRVNPTQVPQMDATLVELPVLVPILLTTALVGVVTGLIPALRVSGVKLAESMTGGSRQGADRAGVRTREGLVVLEVATAMVLVSSAVLLVRSFQTIQNIDVGFTSDGVSTARLDLPQETYGTPEARVLAAAQIRAAVRAIPGVEWVELWTPGGPANIRGRQSLVKEGEPVAAVNDAPVAARHGVTPGSFESLEIDILLGRAFTEADDATGPAVVILSETLAESLWPGEDPIGRRLHGFLAPGTPVPEDQIWTVVGVAEDVRHTGRVPNPFTVALAHRDVYFPLAQRPSTSMTLVMQGADEVDMAEVNRAVHSVDPNLPVYETSTIDAIFRTAEAPLRFATWMMVAFAAGALGLAAFGVFGVLSFTVAQRTREIGLRSAMGASRSQVLGLFLKHGAALALLGLLVGTVSAKLLEDVVVSLSSQVGTVDPFAMFGAAILLLVVALGACLAPAYRASRLPPASVLRD